MHHYNRSLTLSPCQLCSMDGCQFPSTCQGDPWKYLLLSVQKADRNMSNHRRENLDHYLRYGILMFTCNAAVLVDSSKWVTENASYSIIAWFCRGVIIGPQPPDALFISYNVASAMVALCAVSLVLISASLLMCHLSRHWLREFMNQPQFSHKNQLAFRQIHYDALCRWGFFNICDIMPILLFLGATFSNAGLILFLWQLNSPNAYVFLGVSCVVFVYHIVITLHPSYCFLQAPQDGLTSDLSPFRSPSSWLFSKLFMNWSNFKSLWRKRASPKYRRALLPLHSQSRPPIKTKSIDWLEQDCSLFMQGDNAPDSNIPLTNALIWIDSNPTIEKTTKVVVSIYHAVTHLHLPNILPLFKEMCTGSESGLAGIIATASQKFTDVNDAAATAFLLKSWLELHVTRLPELGTQLAELEIHYMNEVGKRMLDHTLVGIKPIDAFLIPGRRLPTKRVHSLLSAAKTCLAKSKYYYEGTFKLIFQVIFQFPDSANERQVRSSVLAILTECKQFAYSFRGSGVDEQQARQFMSELGEFLSDVYTDCDFDPTNGQQPWSPRSSDIWKDIITIANEVFYIASVGVRDTFLALPTKQVDPTNALTMWSPDTVSYPKFSEPEALIRIEHADADFRFQRT